MMLQPVYLFKAEEDLMCALREVLVKTFSPSIWKPFFLETEGLFSEDGVKVDPITVWRITECIEFFAAGWKHGRDSR